MVSATASDAGGAPAAPEAEHRFLEPRGILALWFGVLGPPVIWLARLTLSYILVPYVCWWQWLLPLHAVTFGTLALTGFAGSVAWRSWQRVGRARESDGASVTHRTRFLAMFGLLSAAFFFFVIAAEGVSNFLIDPCLMSGRRVW